MTDSRWRTNLTTAAFVATAVALAWLAGTIDSYRTAPKPLSEEGQPFFPDFTDPLSCTALEIVGYDEATATAQPLKVEQRGKAWLLRSHHDYPAKAEELVMKTAAALVDLKRGALRSMSPNDHATYGVIDPLDQKNASLTGRGKRVTLRNAQGVVLADYILGHPVEGKKGERYVRVPGEMGVYAVKTDADPSSHFRDWVASGILGLSSKDVVDVRLLDYSIDETTGTVSEMHPAEARRGADGKWSAVGEGVRLRQATLDRMLHGLASLGIVDVQSKPPTLAENLRLGGAIELSLDSITSLRRRGYFFTPNGRMLANEGELRVRTSEGLVYTLRFGEIAQGANLAVDEAATTTPTSAPGTVSTGSPTPPPAPAAPRMAPENAPRYLFVTVRFDNAEAPAASAGSEPAGDDTSPAESHAQALARRFAPWYYVISGEDFERLRPRYNDLVR